MRLQEAHTSPWGRADRKARGRRVTLAQRGRAGPPLPRARSGPPGAWDPELLALRATLEQPFLAALRADAE
ncbi:hypothetical protein AB0L20_07585, partial [Streptomyces albidoflavus]